MVFFFNSPLKILIKWICDTLYGFPIKKNNGFYFQQQQTVKNSPRKLLSRRTRARDGGRKQRHDLNTFSNCSLIESYRWIWTVFEIETKGLAPYFRLSLAPHSIQFVVIKHCTIGRHICYEFSLVCYILLTHRFPRFRFSCFRCFVYWIAVIRVIVLKKEYQKWDYLSVNVSHSITELNLHSTMYRIAQDFFRLMTSVVSFLICHRKMVMHRFDAK